MLSNFHTHTVFCDGKNTPEEIVQTALEKGFSAIGFSGHGYTDFDTGYCIRDLNGYISEINRLKEKYKKDIQVYLGIEEDAFSPVDRSLFDYMIGSSHYFRLNNQYYSIDFSYDCFKKCLDLFHGDVLHMADVYYRSFCDYILFRKPDIIGHFDLITKYDELDRALFLHNEKYHEIAQKYILEAAKSGSIFEINTGAISRGLRNSAYPSENLLYTLKKLDAPIILSSDSHSANTLDCAFDETKNLLRDIGFTRLYTIDNGKFVTYNI